MLPYCFYSWVREGGAAFPPVSYSVLPVSEMICSSDPAYSSVVTLVLWLPYSFCMIASSLEALCYCNLCVFHLQLLSAEEEPFLASQGASWPGLTASWIGEKWNFELFSLHVHTLCYRDVFY